MGVKDAHVFPACSAPSSASGLSQWPKPRGPVGKLLISVGQALTYVMQPTKLHVERDDVRIPHRTQGENVGCAKEWDRPGPACPLATDKGPRDLWVVGLLHRHWGRERTINGHPGLRGRWLHKGRSNRE